MGSDSLAIVSLGSNLGESAENIRHAFGLLERFSVTPIRRSSLWISSPLDCPPGAPDFINAIAVLAPRPGETPESLLTHLREMETAFGRTPKKVFNESRTLDLDLICFGKKLRNSPDLTLPHPRAHLRGFVLHPLEELLPDYILPGQTKSVKALLHALRDQGHLTKLPG